MSKAVPLAIAGQLYEQLHAASLDADWQSPTVTHQISVRIQKSKHGWNDVSGGLVRRRRAIDDERRLEQKFELGLYFVADVSNEPWQG